MEELLDITDEHNNPLGIAKPRSLVHKDGDWHRTVHVYITNNQGEFLVHLRSPQKESFANRWDTKFGGHVTAGKSYDETVLEELEQEIGLKIPLADLTPQGIHTYNGETNNEHVKLYFYTYNDDLATLVFSDNEVAEVKWMTIEAILSAVNKNPSDWTVSAKGFQKILRLSNDLNLKHTEMPMEKIIIFDMDGVLFDTIPLARATFISNHPGVTEEMYNLLHTGNIHQESVKYAELMIRETEEEREMRFKAYEEKKSRSKLFDGLYNLLHTLHKSGYTLVLNTNAADRNCFPLLEKVGINAFFDFVAAAGISKDKVEKFKLISEKYKTAGSDMVFITDALGDLRDANTAGVPTITVTWGVHGRDFFTKEHYPNLIKIVDTTDELFEAIQEKFASD